MKRLLMYGYVLVILPPSGQQHDVQRLRRLPRGNAALFRSGRQDGITHIWRRDLSGAPLMQGGRV
jgi:hypothetical protein